MSSSKWGSWPVGWALLAASCKAAAPADAGPPIVPAPDLPVVATKEAPSVTARVADHGATAPSSEVTPGLAPPASAAAAINDAGDLACSKHSFCDVLQLFARAERGDAKARAVLDGDVVAPDCDYVAGDVYAEHCGHVAGFPDGCDIGFSGKVDDAERRKHVVRAGALPPGGRDTTTAPVYTLPKVPLEARAIRSSIAACLVDFNADPIPDPFPVEGKTYPPLWMPVTHGSFFVASAGSPRPRAELKWMVVNAEVLDRADEIRANNQPEWAYSFVFVEPVDAAAPGDR